MPATEKDLAEDAPWKKIQQNTFTRWCNEHLKCVSKRIANLQTDLSDGLRLIALLEVLSQKKMHRKHNQRPTFRQMQLENVSVALEFLDRESIKLVSIGEGVCSPVAPGGRGLGRGAPCIFPSSPGRPLPATSLSPGAAPTPPPARLLSYARASRTKTRWQTGQAGVRTATRPRPPRPGWPEPRLSSHPPQAAPPPLHPWWERARRVGTGQTLALHPAPHPCGGGGPGSPPPTAVWRGPSGFQAPLWFLNKGVGISGPIV